MAEKQEDLGAKMAELAKGFDPSAQGATDAWGKETRDFYAERGLGNRVGFGHNPAVIVIDMTRAFCDPSHTVGANQDSALEAIAELLRVARERDVTIHYFNIAFQPDGRDAGMFGKKVSALLTLQLDDPVATEIHPRIAPREGEMVITKKYGSCFFETNLPSLLVTEGIDTVILTGCSTSGCVRATAIDGVSHGYRVIVPEECVADRAQGPHYANLFDINAKYGDVVPLGEVIEYLERLPADRRERRLAAAAAR